MIKWILSLSASVLSFQTQAANVTIGDVIYGGSGCPQGSVQVATEENQIELLFDSYQAEASGQGHLIERKSCNVTVPVRVPPGYRVSVLLGEYSGVAHITRGASAQVTVESFIAGTQGQPQTKLLKRTTTHFIIPRRLPEGVIWSECGQDVNLRVNTSLLVTAKGRGRGLVALDSADLIKIDWQSCD